MRGVSGRDNNLLIDAGDDSYQAQFSGLKLLMERQISAACFDSGQCVGEANKRNGGDKLVGQ